MMDIDPNRPEPQQSSERPLSLRDFAQRNQITEDRVWELIEEGELAARFVNDEILILREQDQTDEPQLDLPATALHLTVESEILPSEPAPAPIATQQKIVAEPVPTPVAVRPEPVLEPVPTPVAVKPEPSPELRHGAEQATDELPEPASEDHRDLLLFAQDAMNRTMDLSRQLLATKDELIRMKDERIQQLQLELQRNEQEIRRLRKKVEDLETLCRLTPSL